MGISASRDYEVGSKMQEYPHFLNSVSTLLPGNGNRAANILSLPASFI